MALTSKIETVAMEIEFHEALIKSSQEKVAALKREAKALATPPPPKAAALTVTLQYAPKGPFYQYLILHVPGKGYYTTSTKSDAKYFPTWDGLWAFLDGPDVYFRSELCSLRTYAAEVQGRSAR